MDCVYYLDYKKNENINVFKRMYNKIFFRYEMINFDENKKLININKNFINKRFYKKLDKRFSLENGYENYGLLVSDEIKSNYDINFNKVFDGKLLMKTMIINIIDYIEQAIKADFRNESIYICICNDKNKGLIKDISKKFKSVNIVTNKIKKIKRLDNELSKDEDLVYSISNNKKKSLKKAKILINVDFDNKNFEEFCVNRNCIIINLNKEEIKLKNSFNGSIIEYIEVNYNNRFEKYLNKNKFNKTLLYESFIYNIKYNEARRYIEKDFCNINAIIGSNSKIYNKELENNFAKSLRKA